MKKIHSLKITMDSSEQEVFFALNELLKLLEIQIAKEKNDAIFTLVLKRTDSLGATIERSGTKICLQYGSLPALWRAVFTLSKTDFDALDKATIQPQGKHLSAMVDCSRNAVLNVETVKQFVNYLALMGYTRLLLYTEDVYEVENRPYFGYMRGRYSAREIREIDAYCKQFGMELVPCIQTLAHLEGIFRYDFFSDIHDAGNVLLCDEEKTYAFLEDIFCSLEKCFSSKTVHIGMDEAQQMCTGKHRQRYPEAKSKDVYLRHLKCVEEIAERHGFSCIIWGDMAVQFDCIDLSPKTEVVYWDYYFDNETHYEENFKRYQKISNNVSFAGGAYKWIGFAPANHQSFKNSIPALKVCLKERVEHIMLTLWGDDGGEASVYSVMPVVCLFGEYFWGEDEGTVDDSLRRLTGLSQEEWLALDSPNMLYTDNVWRMNNASKYLLYQDVLCGLFDALVKEFYPQEFEKKSAHLFEISQKSPSFDYLFSTMGALCEVLAKKSLLGIKVRKTYQKEDREGLRLLVNKIESSIEGIEIFYQAFEKQWLRENKRQGFEVQQQRIGGLLFRLRCVKSEIEEFLAGKITKIAYLEETLLPIRTDRYHENEQNMLFIEHSKMVTVNRN